MSGGELITTAPDAHGVARLTLRHPGKRNAISVAMWQALRERFAEWQALPEGEAPRAIVVGGADGHFAAGADIAEFPAFRFEPDSLRHYHEAVIAPALQAMLDCDIPIVAAIEGNCVGGGLEIAACCDIRIAGRGAVFGIPIARLGFPIAPGELLAVGRVVPQSVLRELLLEAALLGADAAHARGLLHGVVEDAAVADEAEASARRIAALSPQAARRNKRTLRQWAAGGPGAAERSQHFDYAAHPEHREGVLAFLEKRPPRFGSP